MNITFLYCITTLTQLNPHFKSDHFVFNICLTEDKPPDNHRVISHLLNTNITLRKPHKILGFVHQIKLNTYSLQVQRGSKLINKINLVSNPLNPLGMVMVNWLLKS